MSTNPKNKKIEDNTSIEGKDISHAKESKIIDPEAETKKLQELARMLAENMGLSHFQDEIDSLKANDQYLATKMQEIAVAHDELVTLLKGQNTTATTAIQPSPNITTTAPGFNLSNLEALGTIGEKLIEGYVKLKQASTPQASFDIIDPEQAKQLFRESVLGDFETGKTMRQLLTGGLKKKVVNRAVTTILENHEPE